jgi:hypothetical protein
MIKTVETRQIQAILKDIHIETLIKFLNNYRFVKFRTTPNSGRNARYVLSTDFLNTLYTLLYSRKKIKAAENLKNEYKTIKLIDWEEFICES